MCKSTVLEIVIDWVEKLLGYRRNEQKEETESGGMDTFSSMECG